MKIAILRETRRWDDRRAAITPETAKIIMDQWPSVKIYAQPSKVRVFTEKEYKDAGVIIQEDVSECDILVGVKEVSEESLIEGKAYMMFAHVAKKQAFNRNFFKEMSRKKITLLDYEYFTNRQGARLVAFGHWAGIVGAYYAVKGIMKKYKKEEIPHPATFYDAKELSEVLKSVHIPPLKIVISGDGRVGQGAASVFRENGIREVGVNEFLSNNFQEPVFCILPFQEYVKPKPGSHKSYNDFFSSPEDFESTFKRFTSIADVYIACHFWNPKSPLFFSKEDMADKDFRIRFVADISCDIPGPIASTIRTSTHNSPYYDIDRFTLKEFPAFSDENFITVLAVDNLPTALPLNASESFADDLLNNVFPSLIHHDSDGIIERATILKRGELTPRFEYLKEFLGK